MFRLAMQVFSVVAIMLVGVVVRGASLDAGDEGGPSGCCDWPSCYDERTQLCLDTCLNTWTQCPAKQTMMFCYSQYMSPFGELPLQCFPDAASHLQVLYAQDYLTLFHRTLCLKIEETSWM